ncbi:MAG: hypothetical protein GY708_07455 [Actinomycetia bacterium]|nr:hypothetical protein [Actinomycetes bacterium]MCP4960528.1 hypothetical protein [Actinomycetes bacterium]
MRFLLDQNQPSTLCEYLADAGHDCVHTRDLAMARATDARILEHARDSDQVIISADTDFGELRAL